MELYVYPTASKILPKFHVKDFYEKLPESSDFHTH